MLLSPVEYARPGTVEDAVRLLGERDGARPLAGGQTLLNVMKARAAAPDVLVDLARLDELREIRRRSDGGLDVGAMVTYTELMTAAEVADARPILAEVAGAIADVQVRNRGTVGGNVCSNDPTNHLPPIVVACGAELAVRGADGERVVPAEEFFLGVYLTVVRPGELLTRVSFPPLDGAGDGFDAVTIGKDGTCIANAAATVRGDEARIVLGCVSAVPVVLETAADEEAVRTAVREVELDPPFDVHGPAEYRRHLAETLAVRAVARARGGRP